MEINNAFGLDWTGDSGAAQRSERSEGAGSDEVLATLSATMQQQQPKPKLNKQINILNTLPKRIHAAHNSMFIYCCRRLCPSALRLLWAFVWVCFATASVSASVFATATVTAFVSASKPCLCLCLWLFLFLFLFTLASQRVSLKAGG